MSRGFSRIPSFALVLLIPVLLVGCESTQSKSAKLEAQGAEIAKVEKIKIGAASQSIDIVDQTLLTDQYGTAIVLKLKNQSPNTQIDVPIGLVVKSANGKALYKNDIQGLESGLIQIPIIEGKSDGWWVNDQVLITQKAQSADVTIGESEMPSPEKVPEIEVSPPTLLTDSSGPNVTGRVTNKSDIEQVDMLLYAVATRGGKVVAAGRGLIPKLKTDGKPEFYRIYFIGNPNGAEIEVLALPTTFK